ncbi:zinc finger matrin-type protein 3-like [Spodoptera litura]|uniref:Zinc finger matrin-type protein 3-like n=1 Tax=Spodoptera litura TaxID=69820 RepID=A0A9J7E896_SPOLT|nr:zinc finger matrin-type protein 3-like [Spodoptera litura]XP_022823624.1 zinc finger matrin-type protein 3-like [Spodoptera litura]
MDHDKYDILNDDVCVGPENDDFSAYLNDEGEQADDKKGNYTKNYNFYGQEGSGAGGYWLSGQGSQYTCGRSFGPSGDSGPPLPTKDIRLNPIGFLIKCGVPKEQLRGIPKALLKLMEPQFCGVCNMKLENDNSTRLHYNSKNHTSKQKKWLAQRAELGPHRPNETALKARELYCELCDVHITSKTHADSHYLGKSHRGVVEGRREPKNRYLLQRGMEGRLYSLIRREKKYLKSAEAIQKSTLKPKEPVKVVARPDLELCCKICKVTVTCIEQMASHMNGKKHLSKEKQHILKMMKLKPGAPEDANKTVNADDASKHDVAKTSETRAQKECEGDNWCDGDGTWED